MSVDLADLMGPNRDALIQQWQKIFGCPAPDWI
jgi:hypothetical protein